MIEDNNVRVQLSMSTLKKDRKEVIAEILRKYHLSANLDFDEMALKIVTMLDVYYFKQKSKDDEILLVNLYRHIKILSGRIINHDNTRAKFKNKISYFRKKKRKQLIDL